MDAVIQVETAVLRTVVTNTCVIIFQGLVDDSQVFTWTTVSFDVFELLKNSILTNAPNSSLILV
jgi:hypothetical protein